MYDNDDNKNINSIGIACFKVEYYRHSGRGTFNSASTFLAPLWHQTEERPFYFDGNMR